MAMHSKYKSLRPAKPTRNRRLGLRRLVLHLAIELIDRDAEFLRSILAHLIDLVDAILGVFLDGAWRAVASFVLSGFHLFFVNNCEI